MTTTRRRSCVALSAAGAMCMTLAFYRDSVLRLTQEVVSYQAAVAAPDALRMAASPSSAPAPAAALASAKAPASQAPREPALVAEAPPPEGAPATPAPQAPLLVAPSAPAAEALPQVLIPAPEGSPTTTQTPEAPAARSGSLPVSGSAVAKYGFYIHAFDQPAAVIHQVRQVKKYFPASPIYVMSDGGQQFDGLCQAEGCTFVLCPPANDRWHPWPFMRRLYDAAVALTTEFVIMLEPDNTLHGPIIRPPTDDVGGLYVPERTYGMWEYFEEAAQKVRPGYKWSRESMHIGLCGGSYYRTAAILDALNDEAVAAIPWNRLAERKTKEVFSSDIAMPYLFAARGWRMGPWNDSSQMRNDPARPSTGPMDAAFKHYPGSFPGGKPAYRLRMAKEDTKLTKPPLDDHRRFRVHCEVCWDLEAYKKRWGSDRCANHLPFEYSEVIKQRYPAR